MSSLPSLKTPSANSSVCTTSTKSSKTKSKTSPSPYSTDPRRIVDLRAELKARGEKATGNKAQLVERLDRSIAKQQLEERRARRASDASTPQSFSMSDFFDSDWDRTSSCSSTSAFTGYQEPLIQSTTSHYSSTVPIQPIALLNETSLFDDWTRESSIELQKFCDELESNTAHASYNQIGAYFTPDHNDLCWFEEIMQQAESSQQQQQLQAQADTYSGPAPAPAWSMSSGNGDSVVDHSDLIYSYAHNVSSYGQIPSVDWSHSSAASDDSATYSCAQPLPVELAYTPLETRQKGQFGILGLPTPSLSPISVSRYPASNRRLSAPEAIYRVDPRISIASLSAETPSY